MKQVFWGKITHKHMPALDLTVYYTYYKQLYIITIAGGLTLQHIQEVAIYCKTQSPKPNP